MGVNKMETKSIIRKMFYNEVGSFDCIKCSDKTKSIMEKLDKIEREFLSLIKNKPQILNKYNEYFQCFSELCCEETATYFEEGFRFGVLLGQDISTYIKE